MKTKKQYLLVGAIALAVMVAPFVSGATYAADAGKYYPAVSPDISAKVDTKTKGSADASLSTYYPVVSPDTSAKVDTKTKGAPAATIITYSPAVSPKL